MQEARIKRWERTKIWNMFFYRLFVLLLFAIGASIALKCYSCGEENIYLGHEYRTPLPCEDMDKSENLENFIIECPDNFLGCTTQFKDNEVTRTCDTVPLIDDCKTANGITYCYCSQDLCNGKQSRADAHKASRDLLTNGNNNYPSDDEDYAEMSGHGTNSDEEDESEENDSSSYSNRASSRWNPTGWVCLVVSVNVFMLRTFFVKQ